MPEFTPQDFANKWKRVTAREKQTYQEHFIDLCRNEKILEKLLPLNLERGQS